MTTTMTSGAAARPTPLAEEDDDKYAWHMQHECVAGVLCAAPPGTDVSASTHRCLD